MSPTSLAAAPVEQAGWVHLQNWSKPDPDFRAPWQALEREAQVEPWLSYAWLSAWSRTLPASQGMRLLWVGRNARHWSCALPLLEHDVWGWRVLRAPGTGSQRFGPLAAEPASHGTLAALAAALAADRRWDWLQLTSLPLPIARLLTVALRDRGLDCRLSAPRAQRYLPLDRPWPEVYAEINRGLRGQIEHQQRRLERLGPLRLEIYETAETALPVFEVCLRIEASGWKGKAGTAMLSHPARAEFYRMLVAELACARQLRLCLLVCGAAPIAFDFSCLSHGALAGIKTGYDEAWAKFSPGHVLAMMVTARAHQEQLREFDFLGYDEPRKAQWTPHARELATLSAFQNTVRGRALRWARAARRCGRALHLPWLAPRPQSSA